MNGWSKTMNRSICITGSLMVLAALLTSPVTPAAEHEFVGSKKCKMCHLKEYKSWEATMMARSFDNLKPGERVEAKKAAGLDPQKDYTQDATCVACHSTGYGKPGGFVDLATTPDLAGVGCESCHGAGGTYIKEGYMTLKNKEYKKAELVAVGLVATVGAAQCEGCHNADSPFVADDFVFDFAASKGKDTHEVVPLKYPH
jgi:hypothetical protein